MADQVVLYISAAADVQHEREMLGRLPTEIPTSLGWQVVLSPGGNDPVDVDAIVNTDVHLLVLGGDIRAPVGLEWTTARRVGRKPLPFLNPGAHRTPAARRFVHYVGAEFDWHTFTDDDDLRRKVLRVLTDHILHHMVNYALPPEEIVRLQNWRADLEKSSAPSASYGGTGESSVVLSREHLATAGGVLIGSDKALRHQGL